MTTSMIERVARALEESISKAAEYHELIGKRTTWEEHARAAVEAMREPTDLMGNGLPHGYKAGSHSAREIWRAMIDAALNEDAQ